MKVHTVLKPGFWCLMILLLVVSVIHRAMTETDLLEFAADVLAACLGVGVLAHYIINKVADFIFGGEDV